MIVKMRIISGGYIEIVSSTERGLITACQSSSQLWTINLNDFVKVGWVSLNIFFSECKSILLLCERNILNLPLLAQFMCMKTVLEEIKLMFEMKLCQWPMCELRTLCSEDLTRRRAGRKMVWVGLITGNKIYAVCHSNFCSIWRWQRTAGELQLLFFD